MQPLFLSNHFVYSEAVSSHVSTLIRCLGAWSSHKGYGFDAASDGGSGLVKHVPEVFVTCARMLPFPKVLVWLLGWFWYGFWCGSREKFWMETLVQVPVLVSGWVCRGQG